MLDAHVDEAADQLRRAVEMHELVLRLRPDTRGAAAAVVIAVRRVAADLVDEHLGRPPDPALVRGAADPLLQVEQRLQPALLLGRGTSSARRAAGVPGRGENAAAKTVSKRTSRSRSSVFSNCASVSPQKPTMTSVVRLMPGHRRAQPLDEAQVRVDVYWRPMRRSTASSPDWTGRWRCSHTDGHSAMAAISRSDRSHGCEVTKRRRGMAGTPSAVRRPSIARSSAAMSGRPSRSILRPRSRARWTSAKRASTRQVVAVRVDVLAEQRHLAVAGRGERPRLVDHVVERPAALRSAAERHDAVGTRLVAAVDDRQPG